MCAPFSGNQLAGGLLLPESCPPEWDSIAVLTELAKILAGIQGGAQQNYGSSGFFFVDPRSVWWGMRGIG